MWNQMDQDNRTFEKRVVVTKVRPTWAKNLPIKCSNDEKIDPEDLVPRCGSPVESPEDYWKKRNDEDSYDIFAKVMLLGDSGVGKTCMLVRFRDGTFLGGNYITTVGIDFRNKVVTVEGGVKVKLQIWDTAGQERFRSVTHAYYRDAHALLLLYDVTNKTSFDNIRAWLGEIREYAQDDVVIMLLGNKSDCGMDREVRREEGERLAREYHVGFMETSAKTGLNVEAAFTEIAQALTHRGQVVDNERIGVASHSQEPPRYTCPSCTN